MLEVIADFWKPVKKSQQQEKLRQEQLQIGSSMGFGFVPQNMLSGRRVTVSAINTYQFGVETLTSYVLSQDSEPSVSMIVADTDGEQYLAISRRIPLEERARLFDAIDLESSLTNPDMTRLACKDNVPDFKTWLVSSYKREIQGLKGRIYKGDYRKVPLPATSEGQDFTYTLLVSDSNEHALEIEKYYDGRMEVYATIYRRINDVGEIAHPVSELVVRPESKTESKTEVKPEIKLATKRDDVVVASAPVVPAPAPVLVEPAPAAPAVASAAAPAVVEAKQPEVKQETPKPQAKPASTFEVKVVEKPAPKAEAQPQPNAPINVQGAQFVVQPPEIKPEIKEVAQPAAKPKEEASSVQVPAAPTVAPVVAKPEAKSEIRIEVKPEPVKEPVRQEAQVKPVAAAPAPKTEPKAEPQTVVNDIQKEINTMPTPELAAVNGASHDASKPTLYVHNNAPEASQSVKAVSRPQGNFENESIECDLRVANKLIDEAIRNEMRLNDVVRRVIELPVANPESVQIPVTLTDEDYALLAIRYGISSSDRNAIKRRIIEDLNDFSGDKK